MEFWNGWFDHWGEQHHTRTGENAADELAAMLGAGRSVNISWPTAAPTSAPGPVPISAPTVIISRR
jgi:hypothetical protein